MNSKTCQLVRTLVRNFYTCNLEKQNNDEINKLVPKKVRLDQLFWSSRSSEYEGTVCAQIRGLSAQSPTDLTLPSGTPGAQAHVYDV